MGRRVCPLWTCNSSKSITTTRYSCLKADFRQIITRTPRWTFGNISLLKLEWLLHASEAEKYFGFACQLLANTPSPIVTQFWSISPAKCHRNAKFDHLWRFTHPCPHTFCILHAFDYWLFVCMCSTRRSREASRTRHQQVRAWQRQGVAQSRTLPPIHRRSCVGVQPRSDSREM